MEGCHALCCSSSLSSEKEEEEILSRGLEPSCKTASLVGLLQDSDDYPLFPVTADNLGRWRRSERARYVPIALPTCESAAVLL